MGKPHTRKSILVGFILSVLMISFFAFYANRDMRKIQRESAQAEHIIRTLSLVEALLDDMQDIETGQRGYLLSGNEDFLTPYADGRKRIGTDTLTLKKLTRGDTSGVLYDELLALVREKIRFAEATIGMRRDKNADSSIYMIETEKGKLLMDSIRVKLQRIEEENRLLLAAENRERQQAARSTSSLFIIMAISFFVLMSLLFWQMYRGVISMEHYESQISYLAKLTENTSDAIISTNREGMIQSWNKAAEKIYGYTREEVIGRFAPLVTQSGFTEETIDSLRKHLESAGILNQEVLQFNKAGKPIHCLVSTTPLHNEKGEVDGFVSVLRDISERKKLEEKLLLFNKELEKQVKEKTASLSRLNEQLAGSNRELEQFAYVASHDLQEPLRSVRSFLELLDKKYQEQLDETGKQYIRMALDGSIRMKALITDLLNFSRVGRRALQWKEVDLNQVIQQVKNSLKNAIAESKAEINTARLPQVKGDPLQLELLLQNLVANAIKYRKKNESPRVDIGCTDQGSLFEIFVSDNGIGFDKEHWDSIFNVFYRLHTPAEYPGTGIGLAICKKIVELHGGQIRVESVSGKGSVFYFTIPKSVTEQGAHIPG